MIHNTPQISLSYDIKFSDCEPTVQTPEPQLAIAYLVGGYTRRSAWVRFDKGPTPPPIKIESRVTSVGVEYSVYFNSFVGGDCPSSLCNLTCTNLGITFTQDSNPTVDTTYCLNGEKPAYHFSVSFSSSGEREATPTNLSFEFLDSYGNDKTIDIQSIAHIKPLKPNVCFTPQNKVYVGIAYKTFNEYDLTTDDIARLIIQRSKWSSMSEAKTFYIDRLNSDGGFHDNVFTDTTASVGHVYGYRVSYINKYGEQTLWSDWSWVNVGNDITTPEDPDSTSVVFW